MQLISVLPVADQRLSFNYNNVRYDMRVQYNTRAGSLSMTIRSNGIELLNSIPLSVGANAMAQYKHIINFNMFLLNQDNSVSDITLDQLGVSSQLVILSDQELENAAAL